MRSQKFRMQRGVDQRWYVSHCSGLFKVYRFRAQLKAEEFAKRWATANRPSTVTVQVNGQIEKEWHFG